MDPGIIEPIEPLQIDWIDIPLIVSPAQRDALLQCRHRSLQVDDQCRRRKQGTDHVIQLAIAAVIAIAHEALIIEVTSKDFGVLVNTPILHDTVGTFAELVVMQQAAREEEYLRVKAPGAHITVEIGQVGIIIHSLVESFPS